MLGNGEVDAIVAFYKLNGLFVGALGGNTQDQVVAWPDVLAFQF